MVYQQFKRCMYFEQAHKPKTSEKKIQRQKDEKKRYIRRLKERSIKVNERYSW